MTTDPKYHGQQSSLLYDLKTFLQYLLVWAGRRGGTGGGICSVSHFKLAGVHTVIITAVYTDVDRIIVSSSYANRTYKILHSCFCLLKCAKSTNHGNFIYSEVGCAV